MQRDLNAFKKGSGNCDCCYNHPPPPQISRNTTRTCRDWQSNNNNCHILNSCCGMGPVTATSPFSLNSLSHSIDLYKMRILKHREKLNNTPRIMSSWPGSNPVSLTFIPVGLRDWFLLKRKSGPPGQESLNWGERAVLCNCAKKAPHPCLSVLLLRAQNGSEGRLFFSTQETTSPRPSREWAVVLFTLEVATEW